MSSERSTICHENVAYLATAGRVDQNNDHAYSDPSSPQAQLALSGVWQQINCCTQSPMVLASEAFFLATAFARRSAFEASSTSAHALSSRCSAHPW